jgi:bacillithiol biosynthesis cysteine-adding enzyme BshC
LNIFTGPLYFIYKIVTAINLARDLKLQFPEYNFVPLYWMATEDHDFAEINHVKIEDKKLTWATDAMGATGRISTADMKETLLAYQGYLGIGEHGKKLSELVEEAYGGKKSLADATRCLVNGLFGKYGLLCLDADEPALKEQFADIVYQDIAGQHSFTQISQSNASLEDLGYKVQVNPREINFFYMDDRVRERIVEEKGRYQVLNSSISFSKEELQEEILKSPEKFSPNVVMRPVYQEVILPNLAYIGGGAETTYWLQLKNTFDHYQIPFPILILRNSALVIDPQTELKMHRLGINYKDVFSDAERLKTDWIKAHVSDPLCLNDEQRAIRAVFDQIKLNAYKIDKTLAQSADSAKTRALKLIEALEKKLMRAEKRKNATSLNQIDHLKAKLFPNGVLQERILNLAPLYIHYGDAFIEALIDTFKPLDHEFTVLFS